MNGPTDLTPTPVPTEVVEAAVVVAVDVVAVTPGEPAANSTGDAGWQGTVEVVVVDVVKGRVSAAVDDHVIVVVAVRSNADLWGTARVGDSYVAFCDGGSTDLATLLTPQHCRQLAIDRDETLLEDVREVRAVQRRHLTATQLLSRAEQRRANAGPAFARYLWVAAREALRTSDRAFDRLMAVAEDPATRGDAQEAYLLAAYEDLTFTGAFSEAARVRLVRAMVRSALDPRLAELRARLLTTYVPNLVRVPQPEPLRPGDVFGGDPGLLSDLSEELADPRDPATNSAPLRAWLDTGSVGETGRPTEDGGA